MGDNLSVLDKNVAECIGLWLAEGGIKSKSEITFTNSCWELVDLFHRTIKKVFPNQNYKIRIYIYSKDKEKVEIPYKEVIVKEYIHKRATRPYFIHRIASVKMLKEWKGIVKENLDNKEVHKYILRGFFSGEGNIYEGSHNTRKLRISQGKRKGFIEILMENLGLEFSFREKNRNYVIYGKWNWDIFAKNNLDDLHPDKKKKFWRVYGNFKEEHYGKGYLKREIYKLLKNPLSTKEISKLINRSPARVRDVLIQLKKENKIKNFRVGSVDYWTNDKYLIIISKLKKDYLLFLNRARKTSEFAEKFGVDWKSSFGRLRELEKLNLTRRESNGKWIKLTAEKKVLAI